MVYVQDRCDRQRPYRLHAILTANATQFRHQTRDVVVALHRPGEFEDLSSDVLCQSTCKLLAPTVEAKTADFLAAHTDLTIEHGRQDS